MAAKAKAPGDAARAADLRMIHAIRRAVGIEDGDYRAIIGRISGGKTESSAPLTPGERSALIAALRALQAPAVQPIPARAKDDRAIVKKMRALWYSLYQLGVVENSTQGAMTRFVQRHTGIEALRWTSNEDLDRALNCLTGWCNRVGYQPIRSYGGPCDGRYEPTLILVQLALWQRVSVVGIRHHAALDQWLASLDYPAFDRITPDQAVAIVKTLGKLIRDRAKAESPGHG